MTSAVVTKRREDAPPGFFAFEAAGLRWLGEATATGGAPVVEVLDVGERSISLARLTEVTPTSAAAEAFGRALATTHAAGAPAFGAPPAGWTGDGWIGRQVAAMGAHDRWGESFAQLRLLPYARAARAVGTLSDAGLAGVERVCERLSAGEFDDGRPPERIHGDLWAGNLLFTPDGGVLIDPSAHGGSGQTDLAMLALFGAPQLGRIEAAYAEMARLPDDWRERTGLHQLHPVLVHAVSHGPSYGRHAEALAARYA
jgi:fructosamine-3-kinase